MSFPYCPRGRFLLFESVINNSCLICIEFMLDNSKIKICLQWNYFEVSISRGQLAPEERFPGTFNVHDRQKFKPAVLTICQKWLAKQYQS